MDASEAADVTGVPAHGQRRDGKGRRLSLQFDDPPL
jgi:hypothetical protein